jgi:hypothetical protein
MLNATPDKEGSVRRPTTTEKICHGRLIEMSEVSDIPFDRALDPMERISETLFGLIMALTFICSLGVATGTNINFKRC